jgi:hypothetical protein
MWESMQHLKSRPLFRALGLLWSRMGPARIYVLAGATALLVLASVGLVHLLSSGTGDIQGPTTIAPGPTDAAPDREALIAITEIGSSETKGRKGQKNVAVKIGVAPRPNLRKGEVEIRVAFFDLTETNEMRSTEAEVNYEWLTPIRDWTDPTPKYLVATYEGAGPSRHSLRYGGFVVRVYFEGQLQAERSEPKGLLTALRSKATPSASRAAWASEQAQNVAATVPAAPSSPVQVNRESSLAVPYASPVPDKPGFVYSPHNPKFLIDVRGFPPGTEVNDPNTGKPFKVP